MEPTPPYSGHPNNPPSTGQKTLAYIVHLFTASGAVFALFSLHFIARHDWYNAYLLLVIAVIIDSCDGFLARRMQVNIILPEIDGNLLDNIIDFLVWSIIPAFIVWEAKLLPPGYDFLVISLICIASTYQFCRSDAKSNIDKVAKEPDKKAGDEETAAKCGPQIDQDYFFQGFPSAWILLVYFLIFGDTGQVFNTVILTVCAVLSFVPIKCIYPTRTRMWKKTNIITTSIWLGALLATFFGRKPLPPWFQFLSVAYAAYYIVGSARLTWTLRPSDGIKKT
ncbi:CDP-alcohol phosphatidyltransferase family protein [Candidatus Haliotispira prima]|uniref:Phosphatidylcholine synthase n=1 Tax=Candidatus Haliotispira prima TaxID=3034016 RepID=A0ABY8MI83_9SPIO|nr:CDP-alcohol phosphatidyltransferase family protein [Candidatus Haliotispira prima]